MSSHSFNREAELPLLLTLKLKESLCRYSYSHSVHAFSFAVSLSFPSPLYVPTSPHPHRLSSISLYRTLLLSFCHAALYFIQMGEERHLILGLLPISMMAASVISRNSPLAYLCFNSGWYHTAPLQC